METMILILAVVVIIGLALWSQRQLGSKSQDISQLQAEVASKATLIEGLQANLRATESALETTKEELKGLREEAQATSTTLATKVFECGTLTEEVARLNNDVEALKGELKTSNDNSSKLTEDLAGANASLKATRETLTSAEGRTRGLDEEVRAKSDDIANLRARVAELEAQNNSLNEKLATQKQEIEETRKTMTSEFKVMASEILDEKSKGLTDLNKTNLETMLKPLNENLTSFKQKVEEVYDKESKERFSLGKEVEKLVVLNQKVSEDANNLTKALKGDTKTQGDWGQMILENILEKSGLRKGQDYAVQEYIRDADGKTVKNEDGAKMQPDVILNYPDNRKVVIDSKVSLVAYDRYVAAETKEDQRAAIADHLTSMRKHIDDLSAKNYQDFVASLDFVMMFVPIEPAYFLAMKEDHNLWTYAYNKRILFISPTNLIAVLKMIQDLWRREDQSRNAQEIAERGGKLYDKFVGFVGTLQDVGEHLEKTQKSYSKAMGQLKDGGGNLISQAEKMKQLGAKASKAISTPLLEEAHVAPAQEPEQLPQIETKDHQMN